MFWEWFWDLYDISFGPVQPCPICKMWPASRDCGYLQESYDHFSGNHEYDCIAPDNEDGSLECDGCHHLICEYCRRKITGSC